MVGKGEVPLRGARLHTCSRPFDRLEYPILTVNIATNADSHDMSLALPAYV